MELGILDARNASYNAERWEQLEAMAKGGEHFHKRISKFLPQNPVEPDDVYAQRKSQAHYRSYMGSIINLYTSWLFAADFSIKPYTRGTEKAIDSVDRFYGMFQEDVGGEKQLTAFVEDRFREALTKQTSYWLVEMPSNDGAAPEDLAEYEARGLGRATLKALDREELLDWEENEHGEMKWAIVHTCFEVRESWMQAREMVVETWRVYETELVHTFQLRYKKGQRPRDPKTDVPRVGEPASHGFKRVPIVRLHLKKEVCIGEQTFDTQLEHFRQDNALSWLIRRTCYAQPVFNLEDGESNPPRMGAGYAIVLGKDDTFGWTAPPTAPFDILQKSVEAKRDDIYRIVHQMAQAVDNNAETVGRSADSKEIDAAATRIMLNAYGKCVSEAIELTYELISEARGEVEYEWSVEGFSGYDTATVSSLIANSKEARGLGIPSETFHKEITAKTALALLPEADQRVKDTIRAEIEAATFEVTSMTVDDATRELASSEGALNDARTKAEPVKAKAAMKSASQPKPTPGAPGASAQKKPTK